MTKDTTYFAHDIRNVAAIVGLDAERLERSSDPVARKIGARISRVVDRLDALCASVTRTPEPTEMRLLELCDVVSIVEEACDLSRKSDWPVEIVLTRPADCIALICSSVLFRVVHNIIANAVAAAGSGPNGCVNVKIGVDGDTIHIDIIDNAGGLPAAIVRRFRAASSMVADEHGHGLLAAKSMAEDLDGELHLEQTGPLGTYFRLSVPNRMDEVNESGGPTILSGPLQRLERNLAASA